MGVDLSAGQLIVQAMSDWRHTYRAVWVANLVTSVGMMSFLPFFPSTLRDIGVTDPAKIAVWAGVIYGAAPLTAGLMMPIWGAIGDRFGRKAMVLRAMLAISLFVGCMGFATQPWHFLALRLGQGFFSGFVAPSVTLVSVAAPADRQGQISGSLQSALAIGSTAGPFLGGLLAAQVGVRGVFFYVSMAALLSALIVFTFAKEGPRQTPVDSRPGRGVVRNVLSDTARDGIGAFMHPRLRGPLLLLFALQFGLGATNPQLETYVLELSSAVSGGGGWVLGWIDRFVSGGDVDDPEKALRIATSLLFGGIALVSIFAMPLWGRVGDSRGHRRMLLWCAGLSVIVLLAHGLVPSYGPLLLSRFALGAAMTGVGPLAFGIAAGEIAADRRGGAFGAVVSARTLAVSLGSILGGVLTATIGVRGLFLSGAVAVFAVLLVMAFGERRARREIAAR